MTRSALAYFTAPVTWPSPVRPDLTLLHVVLLRRIRDGETVKAAATAAGVHYETARTNLRKLRAKHGVSTTRDLLLVPGIAARLDEDGAA